MLEVKLTDEVLAALEASLKDLPPQPGTAPEAEG